MIAFDLHVPFFRFLAIMVSLTTRSSSLRRNCASLLLTGQSLQRVRLSAGLSLQLHQTQAIFHIGSLMAAPFKSSCSVPCTSSACCKQWKLFCIVLSPTALCALPCARSHCSRRNQVGFWRPPSSVSLERQCTPVVCRRRCRCAAAQEQTMPEIPTNGAGRAQLEVPFCCHVQLS